MDDSQMGLVIWILSMVGLYIVIGLAIKHSQLIVEMKSLNEKMDVLNDNILRIEDRQSE